MPDLELVKLTDDAAMYYNEEGQATLVWDLFCVPRNLGVAWGCKPC